MTEREAWLMLAEKFDASQEEYLCNFLGRQGDVYVYRTHVPSIPAPLRRAMVERIMAVVGGTVQQGKSAYADDGTSRWTFSTDGPKDDEKEGRVLACLLFANGFRTPTSSLPPSSTEDRA